MGEKIHVSELETNVKATKGSATFTPCTLIVGKNGAGKSALVDALSLVLRGEAYSEGLKKSEAQLFALASGKEMHVSAKLSDGRAISWSTEESAKGTVKKAVWRSSVKEDEGPFGVLSSASVKALLLGDAKVLLHAVLLAAGGEQPTEKILSRFAPAQLPVVRHALGLPESKVGNADPDLVSVATIVSGRELLSEARKDLQRNIKAIEAMQQAGGGALSTEEADELAALEDMMATRMLRTASTFDLERDALQARLDGYAKQPFAEEEWRSLEERALIFRSTAQLAKTYGDLLARAQTQGKRITHAQCPLCEKTSMDAKNLGARREWGEVGERADSERLAALRLEREAREADRLRALQVGSALATISRYDSEAAATERYVALSHRRGMSKTAETAKESLNKGALERQAQELEGVVGTFDRFLGEITDGSVGFVEKRVNQLLPKHVRAHFSIEGNQCVVGLKDLQGGKKRPYKALSGAERAMLVAALAPALALEVPGKVSLVIVDDVWFDVATLRQVLKGLATAVYGRTCAVSQAVVCAVQWAGKVPEGWTRVDVSQETPETAGEEEEQ